jgi:replicative DNA helicase
MNVDVETAVVASLLRDPSRAGEVAGAGLEHAHFAGGLARLLYQQIVDAFYDGTAVDPLTLGSLHAKAIARMTGIDEGQVPAHIVDLAGRHVPGDVLDHATVVRRRSDYRQLNRVLEEAGKAIAQESLSPEEVAGILSTKATKIATSSAMNTELVSFADAGRQLVRDTREAMAAQAAGIDVGAKFGLRAVDKFTKGLKPEEVWILAGEPGVGKSAVAWRLAINFAERQARQPQERQVGTLILSLEMGPKPSNMRIASMLAGVDSAAMREGTISDRSLANVVQQWKQRVNLPMWFSYAPTLKASQLRAVVSEAVRLHNVGLVVIDHFGYFHMDTRGGSKVEEDGEKAAFLTEQIAKPLNVAVMCLAHTRKPDQSTNGRPRLSDLRGSQEIAGYASFVSFIYRPWLYAAKADRDVGEVDETAAEMIWAKSRHGESGTGDFTFEPARMYVSE